MPTVRDAIGHQLALVAVSATLRVLRCTACGRIFPSNTVVRGEECPAARPQAP